MQIILRSKKEIHYATEIEKILKAMYPKFGSMSSFWTLFLRIFLFFNSLSFFFHTACFSISSGVL